MDTEQSHEQLVNSRLAYVSVSRGRYDAEIYTNDAEKLGKELSRDVSKQSALDIEEMVGHGQGIEKPERQSMSEPHQQGHGFTMAYVALVAEAHGRRPRYQIARAVYSDLLAPHTEQHFQFLLNPDTDWALSLYHYELLLKQVEEQLLGIRKPLLRLTRKLGPGVELFKWRECNHFLQNVVAVQLGLHELRQRPEIARARNVIAVGLAYGGIELPAIARAFASARRFNVDMALAMISIYGNRTVARQIRAGNYDYVTQMLSKRKPLCLMKQHTDLRHEVVVIMDDNCTTCTTLQQARDFLLLQGGDVVGAVVVRFPGVNRRVQMRGHGFPDPEVLFSFVRGLIAPSPYTRLHFPAGGRNVYLDQTKMFDKAKHRIKRYLQKNEPRLTELR